MLLFNILSSLLKIKPRKVPILIFSLKIPALCIPITVEFDTNIIGEPDEPISVLQLCFNSIFIISFILPDEHSTFFPYGY